MGILWGIYEETTVKMFYQQVQTWWKRPFVNKVFAFFPTHQKSDCCAAIKQEGTTDCLMYQRRSNHLVYCPPVKSVFCYYSVLLLSYLSVTQLFQCQLVHEAIEGTPLTNPTQMWFSKTNGIKEVEVYLENIIQLVLFLSIWTSTHFFILEYQKVCFGAA